MNLFQPTPSVPEYNDGNTDDSEGGDFHRGRVAPRYDYLHREKCNSNVNNPYQDHTRKNHDSGQKRVCCIELLPQPRPRTVGRNNCGSKKQACKCCSYHLHGVRREMANNKSMGMSGSNV